MALARYFLTLSFFHFSSSFLLSCPRRGIQLPCSATREIQTNNRGNDPTEEWGLDEIVDAVFSKALVNVEDIMEEKCSLPAEIKSLLEDCASAVRVGPSTIPGAGRGLFANRNLEAGTIINWYPVHALCLRDNDGDWRVVNDVEDTTYNFTESAYALCLIGERPLLGWDIHEEFGGSAFYVDYNPARTVSSNAFQSNFINDGSVVETNSTQAMDNYYKQSVEAMNVVFLPIGPAPMVAAVTTADVQKGQELFTMYGGSYWMGRFRTVEHQEDEIEKSPETIHVEKNMGQAMASATLYVRNRYGDEIDILEGIFQSL